MVSARVHLVLEEVNPLNPEAKPRTPARAAVLLRARSGRAPLRTVRFKSWWRAAWPDSTLPPLRSSPSPSESPRIRPRHRSSRSVHCECRPAPAHFIDGIPGGAGITGRPGRAAPLHGATAVCGRAPGSDEPAGATGEADSASGGAWLRPSEAEPKSPRLSAGMGWLRRFGTRPRVPMEPAPPQRGVSCRQRRFERSGCRRRDWRLCAAGEALPPSPPRRQLDESAALPWSAPAIGRRPPPSGPCARPAGP